MRIVHVVPHIDKEAAGPSYSVPRLCQSLAALGDEVSLTCLAARGNVAGVTLELHREWPVLRRFAVSSSLGRALWQKTPLVDIVHNHSLWSMANVAAGWAVPGRGARLVTSPRGTLAAVALDRQRHLKKLLWPLQRRALTCADLLHATSESEYHDIRAQGLRAPVALVPNGIDVPEVHGPIRRAENERTLLFLGRIHPIKGIEHLLGAWEKLQRRHTDWKLIIAGNGEPRYVDEIKKLACSSGQGRVVFPGPLYGADKTAAYASADLFVLPTHSENFGMVVAEALASGCPVVVSKGAPWSGVEAHGCGWWVENTVEQMTATLDMALQLSREQLSQMGARGRLWMQDEYGWQSVGERMQAAYRWLRHGGEKPGFVRLD